MNMEKVIKLILVVIIGYFALSFILGALNIALGLLIKLLIVAGLGIGVIYGIKMLKLK